MNRAAPGTKNNLFLLRQRGRGRNSRLRRRLDGRFRDLIDNWFFDNDRFFRNDRLLDDDGLRFRRSRLCGSSRGRFVNCLRCRLGESGDLPPQFQKFAVQRVVLLRGLVSHLLDAEAESSLSHDRRNGQDGSG